MDSSRAKRKTAPTGALFDPWLQMCIRDRGLVITITVMVGIKNLSPTIAISVILIAQLFVAALIDAFGLMGAEKVAFGWSKYVGLGLMIAGVLLFKWKLI